MAGLANPTAPVTEIESDGEIHELLRQLLAEARLTNFHLALVTKIQITANELEA